MWWGRPYDARKPAHWTYALTSHLTGWAVMIEDAASYREDR